MKKNKTFITVFLVIMTAVILGVTVYMSNLLSSSSPPTQIRKTKAAAVTYTRKVNLFPTAILEEPTPINQSVSVNPTIIIPTKIPTGTPTLTKAPTSLPTKTPTLLAQGPTIVPSVIPSSTPPVTTIPIVTNTTPPTPTTQPLLAYKSTTISPTLIPSVSKSPSPTIKIQPTGVQQLPETGWIQTSSILFIVAASTILFSLLY